MVFKTYSENKRPIRLNGKIRKWAHESLYGKYGDDTMKTPYVEVDVENFDSLSNVKKYDELIKSIVKNAPIRICEDELISGSATLGMAIKHVIPAFYKGEKVFSSISHLTIDYKTTIEKGIDFYKNKILNKIANGGLDENQLEFLNSLLNVINCLKIYHSRYLQATKDVKPEIYKNLLQVPFKPARNFYEAVQSLWFIFSFVRLTGSWPGIGRIDWLLGKYLKNDLQKGVINIKSAREILASFFIKGTEWIEKNTTPSSGDAQHYQNIVLGGLDENGNEVTNEVTYLILDIVEELGISDFPITVRVNQKTSEKLLNKVAKIIRHGGGTVAIYNEPLIVKSLVNYGYPLSEALNFANDGCWEVQIPGKTYFRYVPFDSLALLQKVTLKEYTGVCFNSFEQLYNAYVKDLQNEIKSIAKNNMLTENPSCDWDSAFMTSSLPTSVISLFENGCIDNARDYMQNGATYTVCSPHMGGVADTVNSLYAIKKVVFEQKLLSFSEFMDVLKNDWKESEQLLEIVKNYRYYGTDNDEVDDIYRNILHDFYLACKDCDNKKILFPAGVSTFGREIEWMSNRLSTPSGKLKDKILASNASPTPGSDTEGVTAVIKSYCKADLSEMVTGTALDIKISPKTLSGSNGITALKSIIRAFVNLGGYFVQIDTVSAKTLKCAQQNPSEYKTLSVRVSGWNARFITLTKEWQDMIIQRTEHNG